MKNLLNTYCFDWFSQYIRLVLYVCWACFYPAFYQEKGQYVLQDHSGMKTGRKTLMCDLEMSYTAFPLLKKAFLYPRLWEKELLLFSTEWMKFCKTFEFTHAKYKSKSLRKPTQVQGFCIFHLLLVSCTGGDTGCSCWSVRWVGKTW